MIEIYIPGKPATAGSKRAFTVKRKDGSVGVGVDHDNKKTKVWMSLVRDAWTDEAGSEFLDGPISLFLLIDKARPKGHFRTAKGREHELKESASAEPTTKPDSTKILRAFEDALTRVAWSDDSNIVFHVVRKRYAARDGLTAWIAEYDPGLSCRQLQEFFRVLEESRLASPRTETASAR